MVTQDYCEETARVPGGTLPSLWWNCVTCAPTPVVELGRSLFNRSPCTGPLGSLHSPDFKPTGSQQDPGSLPVPRMVLPPNPKERIRTSYALNDRLAGMSSSGPPPYEVLLVFIF